ncbi:winged helix-turn-helix transcriptional regulator [Nocardioides aequoreus]|uniref:winged helix-turn-helix transcriptional regulator n=1 Tax=Nocardioides aequoreus TaxID=397278 RepID=UPI0005625AD7|nr:helix-turn-helix domain-containing protein [Nocardioides aequoreus]
MDTTTTGERPPALDWSTANCQVERALGIVGQRASLVVLREVFNGVRRFDDMQRHAGLSRQVLSDRLALLVEHDVLRRVPYQRAGERERHEYQLTEKGFDLYPFLVALATWGARYYADPEGPAVEFRHRECGEPVSAVLECDAGHRLDDLRQVAARPGPGAQRVGTEGPAVGSGT